MLHRSHSVIAGLLVALGGRNAHFKGMMQYRTRRETSKAAAFECYDPS